MGIPNKGSKQKACPVIQPNVVGNVWTPYSNSKSERNYCSCGSNGKSSGPIDFFWREEKVSLLNYNMQAKIRAKLERTYNDVDLFCIHTLLFNKIFS